MTQICIDRGFLLSQSGIKVQNRDDREIRKLIFELFLNFARSFSGYMIRLIGFCFQRGGLYFIRVFTHLFRQKIFHDIFKLY